MGFGRWSKLWLIVETQASIEGEKKLNMMYWINR